MGNSFALNWKDIDLTNGAINQANEGLAFIQSGGHPCVSCRMNNLFRVHLGLSIAALAQDRGEMVGGLSSVLANIIDLTDVLEENEPYPCYWHRIRAGVEEAVAHVSKVGSGAGVTSKVVLQCLTMARRTYPELAAILLTSQHDVASLDDFRVTMSDVHNLYSETRSSSRSMGHSSSMTFAA